MTRTTRTKELQTTTKGNSTVTTTSDTVNYSDTPAVPSRYIEQHTVTLLKIGGSQSKPRRLSEPAIKAAVDTMIAKTFTGARANRGWSGAIGSYRSVDSTDEYDMSRVDPLDNANTFYRASLKPIAPGLAELEYRLDVAVLLDADHKRDSVSVEFEQIVISLAAAGQYHKWSVELVDGEPYTIKHSALSTASIVNSVTVGGAAQISATDAIGYAPFAIPKDWNAYFHGGKPNGENLFGLDDHIGMVRDALESAVSTGWRKRFHTKLIGPPGCGKSAILRAAKSAVGEEAVMEFDATATTAAGAMEMLGEFEELPRVLIVEELEKGPTDTFQFLLGLMDDRAEIRKITARKKINRETRLLVFATINDESILNRLMDGALSSRFSNPIYFNRPDRALLEKILQRECDLFNGDPNWIEPTLDMADAMKISDPRRIISIMMLGRNSLINGDYQRRMLTVGMPHNDDVEDTTDSLKSRLAALVTRIQG